MSSRDNAEFLAKLLNDRNLHGEGVEIGVYQGAFSVPFLRAWPGMLHLVDPWNLRKTGTSLRGDATDLELTRRALSTAGVLDRAVLHICYSAEAVLAARDSSLSFAYIDGDHRPTTVKEDLWAWWRKLAPGGLLAGHDYRHNCCVPQAVWDFMQRYRHTIQIAPDDGNNGIWWCWKPQN